VALSAAGLLAACGSSPPTSSTGTTTTAPSSATTGGTGSTGSSTSAPVSYFSQSLSGTRHTRSFTTPGRWRLTFNYNCSTLGHKGSFALVLHPSGRSAVKVTSQQGLGGGGTHVYQGGTYYLSADTPCTWTVRATSP
jgi:hypothetical protein